MKRPARARGDASATTSKATGPRAAIYCRVSTSKAEQREALANHVARCRKYVEARGFVLEERHVLTDTGSGSDAGTKKRLDYQALRAAARAREIDVVVTTKLDRLARSVRELVDLGGELQALGVELIVIDQSLDSTTPAGKLLFHILAALAEFERELIRDRVMRGLEAARAKGRVLGRPAKEVDLEEAKRLRAEGLTLDEVADRIAKSSAARDGKATRVSASWLSRRLAGAARLARLWS